MGEIFDTLLGGPGVDATLAQDLNQERPPRENLTTLPVCAGLQMIPSLTERMVPLIGGRSGQFGIVVLKLKSTGGRRSIGEEN